MINTEPEKLLLPFLDQTTHVVIKLGTGILTPHIESLDKTFFTSLAKVVSAIRGRGKKVLIVSSGAVGFGKQIKRDYAEKGSDKISIAEKQALASLGQSVLIDTYREFFGNEGLDTAQILVSGSDFQSRSHYYNLRQTLETLLGWESVPVINENDAVAIEGVKFGDNDTLSALIAGMFPGALLVILTTVDGFYIDGKRADVLGAVGKRELDAAGGASKGGIGGMKTKLIAAQKLLASGQPMSIASGDQPDIVLRLLDGAMEGTWFIPPVNEKLSSRKRWILHNKHLMGKVVIDQGASEAVILRNASLLQGGVVDVDGEFDKGDVVSILNQDGALIAKGITSLSTGQLTEGLGVAVTGKGIEVVHRDNLVLVGK